MIPSTVDFKYNGESFLLDIAEDNMIRLNAIYKIAGSPKNQDPGQWIRLPSTKTLIKSIDMEKSHIVKTSKGGGQGGGGTWAHWQLALSYAQYLSPELHLAVNQVFKERLEETLSPELGISRSRERARKSWKRQGHDDNWIADRERHIDTHKVYIGTLIEHDVQPNHEIGICTNKIYKGIFNKDKSEIEQDLRRRNPDLPKKINIRDHAKRTSLAAIGLAEALATEGIDENDVRGVTDCAQVSFDMGKSVRLALQDAKSKSPTPPKPPAEASDTAKAALEKIKNDLKRPKK